MPGLLRGLARTAAIAGTATAVSNRVSRRQYNKWSAQDQQAEEEQDQGQQAEQAPVDDTTAQLEQLAQLKNQGILTEEEFTAKKKQILGI
ncbi:MAG TPA: SHOCT domain-containing protein [Candidatus Saccharimonadales bacterium]|nr:SHOCT domain-containing protein [Candidatus Saccharimonadales bacterium]